MNVCAVFCFETKPTQALDRLKVAIAARDPSVVVDDDADVKVACQMLTHSHATKAQACIMQLFTEKLSKEELRSQVQAQVQEFRKKGSGGAKCKATALDERKHFHPAVVAKVLTALKEG